MRHQFRHRSARLGAVENNAITGRLKPRAVLFVPSTKQAWHEEDHGRGSGRFAFEEK